MGIRHAQVPPYNATAVGAPNPVGSPSAVFASWWPVGDNVSGNYSLTVQDTTNTSVQGVDGYPVFISQALDAGCNAKEAAKPAAPNVEARRSGPGPLGIDVLPHVDPYADGVLGASINPATLRVVKKPRYGSVTVIDGGSCDACIGAPMEFSYVSNEKAVAHGATTDSFTYRFENLEKQRSNTAKVTIDLVNNSNDLVANSKLNRHARKNHHRAQR